jgi:hypothetical protein
LILYVSFYTSSSKEENLIDNDYMLANLTIEAEEEIACIDDLIFTFILIFYIFG